MAPQQKGKQGTKGSKQIVEENQGTLKFYRNMALGGSTFFICAMAILYEFTALSITMTLFSIAILIGAYQFMVFMAKTKTTETGTILDTGSDLNMEGGIAEHVKDLIILTTGTEILTLVSNWFWLLLLLIPIRAVWTLWGTIIKPWLSSREAAPDADDPRQEKKNKKMERRMKMMR